MTGKPSQIGPIARTTARAPRATSPSPPIPDSIPTVCHGVPFMTSLELAEMTGKMHGHVLRDIERELEKIGEPQSRFGSGYLDAQGQRRPCYVLPGEYLLFIASAYDAGLRMQIIRHWSALNNGTAAPIRNAADEFAGRVVCASRAERRKREAEAVASFTAQRGRPPTSRERFWIEKP